MTYAFILNGHIPYYLTPCDGYGVDSRGLMPGRANDISLLHRVQTGSGGIAGKAAGA
jgi:hypothetical protein